MTLAQIDALVAVDVRIQERSQSNRPSSGGLPHPRNRVWGDINDLKALEARSV
jgi:hypothetical protein